LAESGLVHTVRGTSGNVHDVTEGNSLLHGQETDAFGDARYQGIEKRPDANSLEGQKSQRNDFQNGVMPDCFTLKITASNNQAFYNSCR
jgi:IS5 family transposase